ncbi:Oidioi.mRNA.OKI2018_I69.PAR.g9210.t1.cds [Oikopleura dioica]|uniref:Oidioi.mRNA.OKI2018_I69.PAR.g9210.t1.cds n=1 Tax=Oikopleura dioica TaxID=34765 RepID=A0ABN7RJG9_OIKDI|nr:Oidioi.mRNA.OKI2018_I69.PAR.g9210.t1.cds [Oikopleura dioica]
MGIKFKKDEITNRTLFFLVASLLMILGSIYNIQSFSECKEVYEERQLIEETQERIFIEENQEKEDEKGQCSPTNSVVFVKTHKTASSTLQNIFLRYGLKHDLKIALPKNSGNRFYYPQPFGEWMLKEFPDGEKPVIIANHLRASNELYDTFPGAKRITILRDIPSLYESSFGYMKDTSAPYRKAGNIETFYANPDAFYNHQNPVGPHGNDVFARNHLAFDLGLEWTKLEKIHESIEYLDKTLDLVVLSDYFKESMILLRNELCWEWEDVLFFVTNERSEKKPISDDLAQKMREWNSFDNAIYDHFNSSFWDKVESYPNFDEDMKILETKLEEIKRFCLAGEKVCPPNDRSCQYNPGGGIKLKAFELSETGKKSVLCQHMIMPELSLSKKIFKKQWPGWKNFYEN